MNNYGLTGARPSIDMSEVASVKEMIFNRTKEKSSALATEREEGMAQAIQNDVMTSARESIGNSRIKPFGDLTQNIKTESTQQTSAPQETTTQQNIPQLKHNIQSVDNSRYTNSMRDETMTAARNQYGGRRANLMATLNFLNTQAAIRMVNNTHSKIV